MLLPGSKVAASSNNNEVTRNVIGDADRGAILQCSSKKIKTRTKASDHNGDWELKGTALQWLFPKSQLRWVAHDYR